MSTKEEIAIKERINELRAKQRKYGKWELEKAEEIRHLIMAQSQIEDDIIGLEVQLSTLKSINNKKSILSYLGGLL